MKVKLEDGTEVEVADANPLAVAARELERVKGMGFDSIEAFESDRKGTIDKLNKQTTADNEMIQRQKTELGDLRKAKEGAEPPKKTDETPPKADDETDVEREDRFRKMNSSVQENLNDDEKAYAEKEFLKNYEGSTPEQRSLLKTHEGRNAFMGEVFPSKKTDDASPVGLFEKPAVPTLSIGEQVAKALREDDKGRGRRPVIPQTSGSGFTPALDVTPVSAPMPQGLGRGGVREALKFRKDK